MFWLQWNIWKCDSCSRSYLNTLSLFWRVRPFMWRAEGHMINMLPYSSIPRKTSVYTTCPSAIISVPVLLWRILIWMICYMETHFWSQGKGSMVERLTRWALVQSSLREKSRLCSFIIMWHEINSLISLDCGYCISGLWNNNNIYSCSWVRIPWVTRHKALPTVPDLWELCNSFRFGSY